MNNLNYRKSTLTSFRPWKLNKDQPNNHSPSRCHTRIQKRLPFWINQQLFWTYRGCRCQIYQFKPGKTSLEWGGIYE